MQSNDRLRLEQTITTTMGRAIRMTTYLSDAVETECLDAPNATYAYRRLGVRLTDHRTHNLTTPLAVRSNW